jgi:hypothetical protein
MGETRAVSLRMAYDLRHVGHLLVGSNGNGLDQKLVAALGVLGRVLLHSLQENWQVLV